MCIFYDVKTIITCRSSSNDSGQGLLLSVSNLSNGGTTTSSNSISNISTEDASRNLPTGELEREVGLKPAQLCQTGSGSDSSSSSGGSSQPVSLSEQLTPTKPEDVPKRDLSQSVINGSPSQPR